MEIEEKQEVKVETTMEIEKEQRENTVLVYYFGTNFYEMYQSLNALL